MFSHSEDLSGSVLTVDDDVTLASIMILLASTGKQINSVLQMRNIFGEEIGGLCCVATSLISIN